MMDVNYLLSASYLAERLTKMILQKRVNIAHSRRKMDDEYEQFAA